jgi:hypothetical protein
MLYKLLFGIALLAALPSTAGAGDVPTNGGGTISEFRAIFRHVRELGQNVVIDGNCYSACTMILVEIPAERICVMPNVSFGFHAPFDDEIRDGRHVMVIDDSSTLMVLNWYPPPVHDWIVASGGLPAPDKELLVLQGKELTKLYHPCTQSLASLPNN